MAKQDTQDWVAAYGVSAAEWSSITAGSETTAEQLRTFLEEGVCLICLSILLHNVCHFA